MRRTTVVLVAAVVAAMAMAAVALAQTNGGGRRLLVYEVEQGFQKMVKISGETGQDLAAGDTVLENLPVFDAGTDERIGETVTRVTVMRALDDDLLVYIDCQVGVEGGNLLFAGGGRFSAVHSDGLTLPVTGGTGAHRGAAGTVRIKAAERNGQEVIDFDFRLTR